ncbi:MAG: PspC domain-containing protein [Candidatus Paceibacterota bacterium]
MKKLYLSKDNKKFLGVCAGIAKYFDLDPTLIRVLFVVLALVTVVMPMVIAYFILYFVLPEDPGNRSMLSRKPHA